VYILSQLNQTINDPFHQRVMNTTYVDQGALVEYEEALHDFVWPTAFNYTEYETCIEGNAYVNCNFDFVGKMLAKMYKDNPLDGIDELKD
jgi:hypothetical protein